MPGFLEGLFADGAMPSIEGAMRFSSIRHRLLLENIANADTPGYRRKDLDVGAFRRSMTDAIESQRAGPSSVGALGDEPAPAPLEIKAAERGGGDQASSPGVLRHDRNDVDVERELASLSRNGMFHNDMATLLRKTFEEIRMAIAERPSAG